MASLRNLESGKSFTPMGGKRDFAPGSVLDVSAAGAYSRELGQVLSSPSKAAVIIFSDVQCAVCGGLAESVQKDLERMVKQGFGAVVVERGSTASPTSKNGVWHLPDPKGKWMEAWNIDRWPHALIVQQGKYAGEVGYADARGESTGKDGKTTFFSLTREPFTKAVEKALQSINKPNQ